MSTFRPRWALCGGWAVDAWLGRQTRGHADVDIAVFQDNLGTLYGHLAGWDLLAHDRTFAGSTSEQWDGKSLDLPAHIHGRSPEEHGPLPEDGIATSEEGFWLDIQINEHSGGDWIFSREHRVAMQRRRCIRRSAWGLPTLIPEALLFFKATAYFGIEERMTGGRFQDEPDFLALLPHLAEEQRRWIRESVALLHPEHPWLSQLST